MTPQNIHPHTDYKCPEEEEEEKEKGAEAKAEEEEKAGEKIDANDTDMNGKRMNGKNHFYMDTHFAANAKRFFSDGDDDGDEQPTGKRRKTKSPNLYLWRISRRNI